jgi:hypothetical protein
MFSAKKIRRHDVASASVWTALFPSEKCMTKLRILLNPQRFHLPLQTGHSQLYIKEDAKRRSALFWAITQQVVVISYQRFGATYRSLLQGLRTGFLCIINRLNAKLNTICHLLALLAAHHILHVCRIRVKYHLPSAGIISSSPYSPR